MNHLFSQTMKLLLISALLTASPWLLSPDIPWNPSKSGHGVKVYTRPVAGSSIKEIKAELELDCSMNTAVACLADIPSYTQWIYQMSEARVIKTISSTEFEVYQRVKTPWPLDDRDVIGHYVLKQDPRSLDVSIITHSVPKVLPVVSGVVRVQKIGPHGPSNHWLKTRTSVNISCCSIRAGMYLLGSSIYSYQRALTAVWLNSSSG